MTAAVASHPPLQPLLLPSPRPFAGPLPAKMRIESSKRRRELACPEPHLRQPMGVTVLSWSPPTNGGPKSTLLKNDAPPRHHIAQSLLSSVVFCYWGMSVPKLDCHEALPPAHFHLLLP
jgi:hypothetical protein